MIKIIDKIINLFLLKKLKITYDNKKKTYLVFLMLGLIFSLRLFFQNYFKSNLFTTLFDLLLIYIAIISISQILRVIILSNYRRRNKFNNEHYDNLTIGISALIIIFSYFLIIIFVLIYIKIDIKAFLTVFGIFFAGLAWVFKEHIVNLVNGLIIMFSKNLSIGDYILINNYKGIIRDITFLHTEIKTDEGNLTYIPNSIVLSSEVTNFSKVNIKRIMFNFDLPATHFKSFDQIEKRFKGNIKKEYPEIIKEIILRVGKLKTKSANIIVEITVTRYNFSIEKEVKDYTKRTIIEYLSKRF